MRSEYHYNDLVSVNNTPLSEEPYDTRINNSNQAANDLCNICASGNIFQKDSKFLSNYYARDVQKFLVTAFLELFFSFYPQKGRELMKNSH